MIDTEALRKKVLKLAVSGQLSKPFVTDTPVSESLAEYVPKQNIELAEVPTTWKYCRFVDVMINRDSERLPLSVADRTKVAKIYDYYGASGIIDKVDRYLFDEDLLLIGEDGANLLSRSTPIAFIAKGKYWVNNHAHVVAASEHILLEYAEIVINSMALEPYVTGVAQPKLSQNMMNKIAMPIAPIEEQQRIVAVVKIAFKVLDEIDSLQKKYYSNMEILKSKVIDTGIQGKLTEQLLEDGTVVGVIASICKNKEAELTGERSFEIPSAWCWIKLGWVMEIERGGSPRPIKAFLTDEKNGISWIKIGDVEKNGKYITRTKEKIKPEGEKNSKRVYPGDFLLTNSMSYGRPYIAKITGCVHDGWLILRNSKNMFDLEFLYYLLSSKYVYNQFCQKASGATVDNLNIDKVANAEVPLPPLAEQKRIVNKIDKILAICK